MPTDNVVPIDAEVARAIARRTVKFRWFVAGLTALWLGALIAVLLFTPLPAPAPFLVLGALLVLAEHRFVLFGDETSMSGSIIVAVASVFVFAETAPLAGPMLIASLGGLYLPHLRRDRLTLALSNGAGFGLSAVGAATAVVVLGYGRSTPWTITAGLVAVAVCADWAINSLVVGLASGIRGNSSLRASVRDQVTSDTDVLTLVFFVGALCALDRHSSLPIAALGLCIALAAFEIRLSRRRCLAFDARQVSYRVVNASLIAMTMLAAFADPGLGTIAIASLAVFLVQATDRLMGVPTVVGFATCGAIAMAAFALELPKFAIALLLLTSAFGAIEVATVGVRAQRVGTRVSPWTGIGLFSVGRRELAALIIVASVIAFVATRLPDGLGSPLTLGLVLVAVAALTGTGKHRLQPLPRIR